MDVKTLCLGVLSRSPCSGYEIRKAFEEGAFSHFQDAGFGSIYPALRRLTEDGLVTCTERPQDSRPDKKVYEITLAGRQALRDAIDREPGDDKLRSDFMFMLFFADLLPPRQVDRLIANRIAWHRRTLEKLESCDCAMTEGERFVLGLGLAHVRAELDYLERHQRDLVDALIPRDVAE